MTNLVDARTYGIIRDLVDDDACWFDHHGGCQAHGYLSLQPGEICPVEDGRRWLKEHASEVEA